MYWDKEVLDTAITSNDPRLRNYFDTFGFIVIRNFLTMNDFEILSEEYDHQYALRTGPKPDRDMQFLPNFVDSSALFTDYFFSNAMQNVYRYFAGEDYLYLGSDGSRFITSSFPWHRDWFTRVPIMKFNFYFNRDDYAGGKFCVIPGSNFPGDVYTAMIQKAMSWPMQNKKAGGLAENGWLPETVNYRQHLLEQKQSGLPSVPHAELTLRRGDVVIFDHRCVHCVQATYPEVTRNLLTILLSKNAFEMQHPDAGSMMREVVDLVVSERNHIGCDAYGSHLYDHKFSKTDHFIRMTKNGDRYTTGAFGDFFSVLDEEQYAAIGKAYREKIGEGNVGDKGTQAYSYGDVHLGINAQNIMGKS